MKMQTQAFEARQARQAMVKEIVDRLSVLYSQRTRLFAMSPEDRMENPHEVTEQIRALATAGAYNMIECAEHEGLADRDLTWVCRKMIGFVRQGGWEVLENVERTVPHLWNQRGQEMPEETRNALLQARQMKNEYEARRPVRNTMHPRGRKQVTPEERRDRLARRAENRQRRLDAQPKKGSSGGGNNQQRQKTKESQKKS